MKLLEYEAKAILAEHGIPVPRGSVIRSPEELAGRIGDLPPGFVLKAQVDVGGRGKAGGILMADRTNGEKIAGELFKTTIKGIPVREILVEERLAITHEYYASIAVDRSSKQALILFTESGGVDIETLAREKPDAIRKASLPLLLNRIPPFMLRNLLGSAPKELGPVIQNLYAVFLARDALLAEINPLVTTPGGPFAADAKLIIDDNALNRQGITQNRDLTERERAAEQHGFSYVELAGTIGVIGNGAGLTMATLDLIEYYHGKAANFLDVGGGADQERVMHAVRLVASDPTVKVIVVNLLGGITRCDDVARGIISAGIAQPVIVRLAGTNEEEGRKILDGRGYRMLDSMEEAVRAAVEAVQ
ncbi:MAG: succinate--CoA ligase subunit beta [Methanomicrobiales archaeon]|nr:succinate--CoA ligase subunit beta [Methanomicrobiales archaeon]NYT20556.1 succinate--CoA ligase subunit beta [Methanomicrobiales archaeon]